MRFWSRALLAAALGAAGVALLTALRPPSDLAPVEGPPEDDLSDEEAAALLREFANHTDFGDDDDA